MVGASGSRRRPCRRWPAAVFVISSAAAVASLRRTLGSGTCFSCRSVLCVDRRRHAQDCKYSTRLERRASLDALQQAAADAFERYESLLDSEGVLVDVATAAALNAASDVVAQGTEAMERTGMEKDADGFSVSRTLRYGAFGSLDGFAGHHWFETLDAVLPRSGNDVADTALKVLADSLLYTPCWCVTFLAAMALMEGRGPKEAATEVRRDFVELLKGNYGITLPFVALIYGSVPVRYQVAGFACLTLAYTIVLSLWANARGAQAEGSSGMKIS
eukprot:TRINITY_DN107708_c0_g1_i1.p1 TRINITY_DN107708_c0_g1~~TRINITY_DN107708_c0_g1_i1.p1  ORF type:complete len:290 (+),score=63.27 TRINITY_DN107708_c0_g1_i1:51-872(+)